jgi:CheY-like chemotaxis protein
MLHVLLVEDEAVTAAVLSAYLSRHGIRVTTAPNGARGLEAHTADPADVVVTDMRMPVMGGSEMATRLRTLYPTLPVIVCTGWSATTHEVEALAPPRLVLPKPVDPRSILRATLDLADALPARPASPGPTGPAPAL